MELVGGDATGAVKAAAMSELETLSKRLSRRGNAHASFVVSEIKAFKAGGSQESQSKENAPSIPPGSPIGQGIMETCWHCE